MCGRFFLDLTEEQLVGLYNFELSTLAKRESDFAPRYNIAPTSQIIACRSIKTSDGQWGGELTSLRWGLVPHWAKGNTFDGKTFNARSETAAEKPAYRDAMRSSRCLIPASGFYEWPPGKAVRGQPKQPYRVQLDSGPMSFAGLCSRWQDPENPGTLPLETCTVLTRPAAGPMAQIHHRMPVILGRDQWPEWLSRGTPVQRLTPMLMDSPLPSDLTLTPVSTRVNSVANDSCDLLEAVEPDPCAQRRPGESAPDQASLFD